MKVSVVILFLLVLITTSASYSKPKIPEAVNLSPTCCLKYNEKVLPRKLVMGYRNALSCHLPAIIFVTKKNREVCTNPSNNWVQEYIKDPNLPLLPSRNLAQVKTIPSGKGQPQLLNSP
ncbi:C-C motif chemokine 16 [Carlito syrichta]|uniref:C-C motif chemokine n=1 Tax=Carlito syrichta TaxID=1868482 RepID=A0A1U7TV05_CARSF|nr:C-C motif chemokine 16 [Carlito syrichta]